MIFPTQGQLDLFKATPGAISVHEMVAIMNVVFQAPEGTFAEMGSHRGKSGSAAAMAMALAHGATLHMVDPLYDMENLDAWAHSCQGHPDNAWQGARELDFKDTVKGAIITASCAQVIPELHGDYSIHAIPELHAKHGDFAYVFLDSDQHTYELLKEECDLLRGRMKVGGILAFHDFASQFLGVEQMYREMLQGGMYHEIPIDWEQIKSWVSANGGEQGNISWHHNENPAPCFFGALVRVK